MIMAIGWLMRSVKATAFAFFLCWAVVGWIETSSFDQPMAPQYPYEFLHEVKGETRYFTEFQHRAYTIAKPTMVGAFFIAFPTLIFAGLLEQRIKERAVRRALERDRPG